MNIRNVGVKCLALAAVAGSIVQNASGTNSTNSTSSDGNLGSPASATLGNLILGVGLGLVFCIGVLLYCGKPWEVRESEAQDPVHLDSDSEADVDLDATQ